MGLVPYRTLCRDSVAVIVNPDEGSTSTEGTGPGINSSLQLLDWT